MSARDLVPTTLDSPAENGLRGAFPSVLLRAIRAGLA